MARFRVGARSAGAGSSTLPVGSLYASAAVRGVLKEIGVFNTTATACAFRLVRLTTAGTQGAGLTEAKDDSDQPSANCTGFDTHTGAPTLGEDLGVRAQLGASVGSGVIIPLGEGVRIPIGTANGIGIVPVGTGQVVDWYMIFEE